MNFARIDHTAIVVSDMDKAVERYHLLFRFERVERTVVTEQAVEVAFLSFEDTRIELIRPTDGTSGVARFLARNGESLHHIGVAVPDIEVELERLRFEGVELIDRHPRQGVHGRIAFIHPRSTGGVLVELVEDDYPH